MDHLVKRCEEAHASGADFPTVWQTILRGDPAVLGLPVQAMKNGQPVLRVRLVTGHDLVRGPHGYSVE
jgi:hypothetical protein